MWLKPDTGSVPDHEEKYEHVQEYFGSLGRTGYTLFAAMTGGVSWKEPADDVQAFGWVYFLIFMSFIFFTVFSVMNIVTGVFVDGAIQQAEADRSAIIDKQLAKKASMAQTLEEVLLELDEDSNGYLTREEWDELFEEESLQAILSGLQVEVVDAKYLWDLLDANKDGTIDISEFVDGMMRLKGSATSIDMHHLLQRVHNLFERVKEIHDCVFRSEKELKKLQAQVLRPG